MGVSRRFAISNHEAMSKLLQDLHTRAHPPPAPLPASPSAIKSTHGNTASPTSSAVVDNNTELVSLATNEDLPSTAVNAVELVENAPPSSSQCVGLPAHTTSSASSSSSSSSSSQRCKRKATEKCIHNMCFHCCYGLRKWSQRMCSEVGSASVDAATLAAATSICPSHYMKIVKRDRKRRFV